MPVTHSSSVVDTAPSGRVERPVCIPQCLWTQLAPTNAPSSNLMAKPKPGELRVRVELVRLLAYLGFWFIVALGVILTKANDSVPGGEDNSLLTKVFGYNNICVYFDFAPSNHVLPIFWAFTMVLLLGYIVLTFLMMRRHRDLGQLSNGRFNFLCTLKAFEAITVILFSNIFAVSPTGANSTLIIHTIPFLLLQAGMVSLGVSNTLHGFWSKQWARLGLGRRFHCGAIAYCVLLTIIVAFKIPTASNALSGHWVVENEVWEGGMWSQASSTYKAICRLFDYGFLIFAALIPVLKSLYFLFFFRHHLDSVAVAPSYRGENGIEYNQVAGAKEGEVHSAHPPPVSPYASQYAPDTETSAV